MVISTSSRKWEAIAIDETFEDSFQDLKYKVHKLMKKVLKLEIEKLQAGHVDSEDASKFGKVAKDIIALGTALLIPFSQKVTVMAPMDLRISFLSGVSSMEKKFQEMDQMHLNFRILMLIISNLSITMDNSLTEWECFELTIINSQSATWRKTSLARNLHCWW